jgi:C-terminal processing protease CtpA/Prc
MRRFNWIFDYQNNKVYFKKNSDFNDKFNYDMSGLVLIYDGYQEITQYINVFSRAKSQTDNSAGYNKIKNEPQFYLEKRPVLKVGAIRPNSSAFEAGFIEGDEIVSISGRPSYRYDLQELMRLFSSEQGKKINFEIRRFGILYDKSLILRSRFLE